MFLTLNKNEQGYDWFIAYVKSTDKGNIVLDHLCREKARINKWWRYPTLADVHQVQPEQILDVEVKGEWKYDSRMNPLILVNTNDIVSAFNNALKKF